MRAIAEVLDLYRNQPSPMDGITSNPFKLASSVAGPVDEGEIDESWAGCDLPSEARELWAASREGRLFEDLEYGQWGLVLLNPAASAARTASERAARPSEFRREDVVVGEFLGDLELVVVAPSEARERRVLIALPLDGRSDWYAAAPSLSEFLARYFHAVGDKYWERLRRREVD